MVSEKHDKHVIHYDAVGTVIAVDAQGRATRSRYEVKELTSNGQRLPISTIELTRHAKKNDAELIVDGSPATDAVRNVLSSLLKLRLGGATDDDVFGTKIPQPIGAHWPIDTARALLSFKEDDGFDVSSIEGDVSLEGTTRVDGKECLSVRAVLSLGGVKVPDVPDGTVVEESHLDGEFTAALPIDGPVGRAAEHHSMTTSFRLRVPSADGAPMIVSVQGKEIQDGHDTAL